MTRHLDEQGRDIAAVPAPLPRATYRPRKLSQRPSVEAVAGILAAYEAGASSRELAAKFDLAHNSVQQLLRQQGVTLRRRRPRHF